MQDQDNHLGRRRDFLSQQGPSVRPLGTAAALAVAYVLFGSAYIWFSGRVAAGISALVDDLQRIELIKGLAFIGVTGILMFLMNWLLLRRIATREAESMAQRDALAASEAMLHGIFSAAGMGIVVVDVVESGGYRIVAANPAYEKLMGVRAQDIVGRTAVEVAPIMGPSVVAEIVADYDRCLETGGTVIHEHMLPGAVREKWYVRQLTPIRDRQGRITRVIGSLIETTDMKIAEAERRRLELGLRQSQKMHAIGQLASGVAHDFNNLLTVISAHLELLAARLPDDAETATSLKDTRQAVEQATGLSRSLLTFSQHIRTQKRPVNLCTTVEQTTRMLRRIMPATVNLKVYTPQDRQAWVLADEIQIQQVILNLALNARDAMPAGGQIEVSIETVPDGTESTLVDKPGPYVRLEVQDSGEGIPLELRERIFEPFFTTKQGRGTGLGLSVVQGIVREHEGNIRLVSEPGRGTTFTIDLPAALPEDIIAETGTDGFAPRGRGQMVLVAEDDELVRQVVNTVLSTHGYQVVEVADGEQLLEAFRKYATRVRMLFLDLDLPGRDGLECLRKLRCEGYHTPAILSTGTVDAEIEDELDGLTVLLPKPFRIGDLVRLVHTQTAQSREKAPLPT